MRNFAYVRARSVEEARHAAAQPAVMLLAGGTTLVDLVKCGVAEPEKVVDITHLKGLDAYRLTHKVPISAPS
jgi:xanthine dehydrogenase YagS FAD-binding subunit